MLRQALSILFGKPVLDDDILAFDPTKFVQLLMERFQESRVAGSIAWIQVTDAEDFLSGCASADAQAQRAWR